MTQPTSRNIFWHHGRMTREDRERGQGHRGVTLWFTGLSGSGKSTLAVALEDELFRRGCSAYVLDGDNVRHGLNADLGFSPEDRKENIRRIGEVAKLLTNFGAIVLTAFVSPYGEDREQVRRIMKEGDFVEIFVDCPLEVCESRDPKGLYQKARAGQIPEFTGISAPYEEPENPEVVVRTDQATLDQCVARLISYLSENGYLNVDSAVDAEMTASASS